MAVTGRHPNLVIQVPADLVLDAALSPAAKLVCMLLYASGTHGCRPCVLCRRTGLSKDTVFRTLEKLASAGLPRALEGPGMSAGGTVRMPVRLLEDRRVGVRGRVLYGQLQLLPGFRHPAGWFSYAEVGKLACCDPKTARVCVRELASAGWLKVQQKNRRAPVQFWLRDPFVEREETEVAQARQRLERAPFLGEALMREYLSLLVDSEDYQDNAAPGFLVNPLTGERMEFDRFYPPGVAFEFNGPQHYGATEMFGEEEAARQRARDYMKLGICAIRGIRLVVVHPEDLSVAAMRRKVAGVLPVRDLAGREHLAVFLEAVGRRYRLAMRRRSGQAPAPPAVRRGWTADGVGPAVGGGAHGV